MRIHALQTHSTVPIEAITTLSRLLPYCKTPTKSLSTALFWSCVGMMVVADAVVFEAAAVLLLRVLDRLEESELLQMCLRQRSVEGLHPVCQSLETATGFSFTNDFACAMAATILPVRAPHDCPSSERGCGLNRSVPR